MENEDYYIVRDGDTLESIAERFLGRGLAPLLTQINGIDGGDLRPGMTILLHPNGLEQEKINRTDPSSVSSADSFPRGGSRNKEHKTKHIKKEK